MEDFDGTAEQPGRGYVLADPLTVQSLTASRAPETHPNELVPGQTLAE